MEYVLDPALLVRNLIKLGETDETSNVSKEVKYLLKALFDPLLNGEYVNIGELDYNAFELEDMDDFEAYLTEMAKEYASLRGVIQSTHRLPAQCGTTPAFC